MKAFHLPASTRPATRPSIPSRAKVIEPDDQLGSVRWLIWLYLILWLVEGGLRRWVLPGLASPLLFVRDPVVLAIYMVAYQRGAFPRNNFLIAGAVLAAFTFVSAVLFGHGNLYVALFGVRCDFIHLPLMFVMARVIRSSDLIAVARIATVISVPFTMLLVAQFYSPQDAWVNRGLGGSMDGAGFSGALGRFRPPGTFSFIAGPAEIYPIFTACWFALLLARKLPAILMIASGAAILVAIPVSISRALFFRVALVAITGTAALFISRRISGQLIMRGILAVIILPILASTLPAFRDGMEAFSARWENATTDNGGFKEAVVDRILGDLFGHFSEIPPTGFGTGYSSNVGQKVLTEEVGFGASEAEWGRLLCDNGYFLGVALVIYRACLAGFLVRSAWRARLRGSAAGIIFVAAAFVPILNGQWAQTTILGAAIIGGGLALASCRYRLEA